MSNIAWIACFSQYREMGNGEGDSTGNKLNGCEVLTGRLGTFELCTFWGLAGLRLFGRGNT